MSDKKGISGYHDANGKFIVCEDLYKDFIYAMETSRMAAAYNAANDSAITTSSIRTITIPEDGTYKFTTADEYIKDALKTTDEDAEYDLQEAFNNLENRNQLLLAKGFLYNELKDAKTLINRYENDIAKIRDAIGQLKMDEILKDKT